MDQAQPYTVTAPEGKVNLVIMDAKDGLPAAFALMGARAANKVAIRIGGGCKGMNADDKAQMLQFFGREFDGFQGVAFSGGSRMVTDGQVDPMVTDIPGVIASQNEGCIALGTLPRVELLTLQDDSRLVLDQWGNAPNPDMSGILIVQNGPDGEGEWDLDVATYVKLMDNWGQYAGFTALGGVFWNGGGITEDEILRCAKKGWLTVLIKGSGRVTDEIAAKLEANDAELLGKLPKEHHVRVVSKDSTGELAGLLAEYGFLS